MGDDAENALKNIISWCANWQDHKSPYAIRYFPVHLYETKCYDDLFALVQNRDFHSLKLSKFHFIQYILDDVRYALQAAINKDDLVYIIQFAFLYPQIATAHKKKVNIAQLIENRAYKQAKDVIYRYKDETVKYQWYIFSAWIAYSFQNDKEGAVTFISEAEKLKNVKLDGNYLFLAMMIRDLIINDISIAVLKSESIEAITIEMAKTGNFQQALGIAKQMKDSKNKSVTLSAIVTEILKTGDFQQAIAVAKQIEDGKSKSAIFSAIATEILKAGDFQQAIAVAKQIEDGKSKSVIFSTIAVEILKTGDFQQAIAVAEQIEKNENKSVALGTITVEALRTGNIKVFQQIIEVAIEQIEDIDAETTPMEDIEFRFDLLGAIVIEIAKTGDFQRSFAITERIKRDINSKKDRIIVSLAAEIAKAGKFQYALDIAEQIYSDILKSEALKEIVSEISKTGDFQYALDVFVKIIPGIHIYEALKAIASEIAKTGNFQYALDAVEISVEKAVERFDKDFCYDAVAKINFSAYKLKSETLLAIATELTKIGDKSEANEIFHQALAVAGAYNRDTKRLIATYASLRKNIVQETAKRGDFQHSIVAATGDVELNIIVKESIKAENFQYAFAATERMEKDIEKSKALSAIAVEAAKTGKISQAKKIFQQAFSILEQIDIGINELKSLIAIFTDITKVKDIIQPKEIFQKALAIIKSREVESLKSDALSALAVEIAKIGDFQLALTTVEDIEDNKDKFKSLSAIAAEVAIAGDIEQSKEVFHQALTVVEQEKDSKAGVLGAIAAKLIKLTDISQRRKILQQVFAIVSQDNNSEKPKTQCTVIREVVRSGDIIQKKELFQEILISIERIEDRFYKASSQSAIAVELAKSGDFKQAIDITSGINDVPRHDAWIAIAFELIKTKSKTNKKELFQEIFTTMPISVLVSKPEIQSKIIIEIAKTGDFQQAISSTEFVKGKKAVALSGISVEMANAGYKDKAHEIFQQAIAITKEERHAFKEIAVEIAKLENIHQINEIFQQLLVAAKQNGFESYFEIQNTIAVKLAKLGDFQQALTIAKEHYYNIDTLSAIAVEMANAGNKDNAEEIVQQVIEQIENDDYILFHEERVAAIKHIVKTGNFHKAIAIADTFNEVEKAEVFIAVISEILNSNNNDLAKEIFRQAFEFAQNMKTDIKRYALFSEIIRNYVYLDVDESFVLLSALPIFEIKMRCISDLANFFAENENLDALKRLIPFATEDFDTVDAVMRNFIRCRGIQQEEFRNTIDFINS